jgi:hypothetical protein
VVIGNGRSGEKRGKVASPGQRDYVQRHSITGEPGAPMTKTSLDKSKIKILLLEGIHASAVEAFRADGYTNIESHSKALSESKLLEVIATAISSASAPPPS